MADIIKVKLYKNKEIIKNCLFNYEYFLKDLLKRKGGETFSFTAINTFTNEIIIEYCLNKKEYEVIWDKFKREVFKKIDEWEGKYILFIFYGRTVFEIENFEEVIPIPYLENDRYVWLSGSITNLDEIEKALGKKFTVPSQAVAYHDVLLDKNIIIKGVFTAFVYDLKIKQSYWLHNGVPIWATSYEYKSLKIIDEELIEWEGTYKEIDVLNPGNFEYHEPKNRRPYYFYDYSDEDGYLNEKTEFNSHHYILFSGGVDSVITAYHNILGNSMDIGGNVFTIDISSIKQEIKYILVYFDYGSKTSKQEIVALKKFYKFIKEEAPDLNIEYRIVNVKNLINEFRKYIVDNDKSGMLNSKYFPYKNTELAILLSKMIDKDLEKELFFPYIVFGFNSTKSILHSEYNEAWLYTIENIIAYGGNNYKYASIITPFIELNKSNIIIYMIKYYGYDKTKELLDIAYSCVDPDENGEPCGKCENCVFREKSYKDAVKYIKKSFFKKSK